MKNDFFSLFLSVFFKLLPNFSDFIYYDDCIGKIYQSASGFYLKKKFYLIKKGIISSKTSCIRS